ncbi:hypothetical protein BH23PAT2_BH23PAT2_01110 [soil metagenome]
MDTFALAAILTGIAASTGAFIWVALRVSSDGSHKTTGADNTYLENAEKDVEHIFNDEFREELRNRGRLHFEKIIGENAMFLQQDLRLTTSQLNEFMKNEITAKLQDEFSKYEESITDAKQMAIESITKTQEAIEEQRQMMGQQLLKEIEAEKTRMVGRFEENLGDIVNHYVLAAIGNQIDLNDQLDYIISDIEANKEAIIRDLSDGA